MFTSKTSKKVLHFNGREFKEDVVELIKESPLTIYLNDKEFITLLCYPDNLEELAVGFLKSEGLIETKSDIKNLKFSKDKKSVHIDANVKAIDEKLYEKRIVTTGCGKGTIFYFALDSIKCSKMKMAKKWHYKVILEKMREINRTKGTKNIGGLHVCGLFDGENFVIREDIGRHNALDKIVGYCTLNEIDLDEEVIFTTGRISSEILLKSAKINAGVVVSRSTPTDLSFEIAKRLKITLIGYARGNQMTIYTAKNRILVGD